MKKAATVLGVLLIVGALAYPVFAWGPGGGRGYGMGYGSGPGGCWKYGGTDQGLTDSQWTQMDELHQKFYNETSDIRNEMWAKQRELNTVMSSAEPDLEQAKGLQKELNNLRAQMAEKRLEYDVQARKIAPDAQFQNGRGYGKGYGRRGGPGFGGYGPCWN